MKRLLLLPFWGTVCLFTLVFSFSFLNYRSNYLKRIQILKKFKQGSLAHTSISQVLGFSTPTSQSIAFKKINQYLNQYRSPMAGSALSLVETAQDFQVDPFLMVAIAQCESNLGKKSYQDCYNPFGLGITSKDRLCFASWEESYYRMAKTLKEKYHRQGLNTPEEIMIVYCPNSLEKDGAWAKCVNRFKQEAENQAY